MLYLMRKNPSSYFSFLSSNIFASFLFVMMLFSTASAENTDSVQFSQTKTIDTRHSLSKQYGMSISEWNQYESEMQGYRGKRSPNLHPIAVLGMREGITASERDRLAERLAREERKIVTRELAFEAAFQRANKRLYGNQPLFKSTLSPHDSTLKGKESISQSAWNYYLTLPCPDCKSQIQTWLSQGNKFTLYIDANSDKSIREFASSMGISPLLVPGTIKLRKMRKKDMLSRGFNSLPHVELDQLPSRAAR